MGEVGIRFFVIATAKRGRVWPMELLNADGQARAFSRWREDESRAVRVGFELGDNVVWARGARKPVLPDRVIESRRESRMVELAAITGRKRRVA